MLTTTNCHGDRIRSGSKAAARAHSLRSSASRLHVAAPAIPTSERPFADAVAHQNSYALAATPSAGIRRTWASFAYLVGKKVPGVYCAVGAHLR